MNEINLTSDTISLDLLKNGDRAEFAKLVEAYSGQIYKLALRILENQRDAEDVLQETFLKAYRSIANFEGRSSLATWLYRIATNEALMIVRKRKPELSLEIEGQDDHEDAIVTPYHFTDWRFLPEKELQSSEAKQHMDQAVQRLPASLRAVFLLRDVEGLSVKETAEVLRISEGAVKTRLLRARLRLREDLSEYFGKALTENAG
ncbi:MAG: sigma-70 family RNA polymerase sigma factor [Anaerolineae bacterium]|nr:sigma-70 family RNA polymerase sigma factor [Anaerolineae bacterium]